jgi:hypothetical protein
MPTVYGTGVSVGVAAAPLFGGSYARGPGSVAWQNLGRLNLPEPQPIAIYLDADAPGWVARLEWQAAHTVRRVWFDVGADARVIVLAQSATLVAVHASELGSESALRGELIATPGATPGASLTLTEWAETIAPAATSPSFSPPSFARAVRVLRRDPASELATMRVVAHGATFEVRHHGLANGEPFILPGGTTAVRLRNDGAAAIDPAILWDIEL